MEQPVASPIISKITAEPVIYDQASLCDSIANFDYAVEIPLDAAFVRVNVPVANLRTTATSKSQLKQKVRYGELLIKLEISGDWLKVQTLDSGLIGYVFADLVQ
ncbi:SH3 domain-containing protein [Dyadobacter chenhuakuii]|uniref:SH3 domain-containing protein n=1 Tax=Dyadobacter chenhuakuii TaxID=2909339 RepID=A0A9X1TUP7_9BACT|nr:SH3 domain-containing protein [Dyadobacter chenhuakuii]MCF2500425.1 SH3 domain-containing protein [Dyadobacter chenhuakuii]